MINSNDLRIGNWVNCTKNSLSFEILELRELYVTLIKENMSCNYSDLQPVPLTSEMLSSIGFKKVVCYYMEIKKGLNLEIGLNNPQNEYYCLLRQSNRTTNMPNLYDDVVLFYSSLKYVHQLQNLYYTLTNSELEITL